jgi:hypothetical protein
MADETRTASVTTTSTLSSTKEIGKVMDVSIISSISGNKGLGKKVSLPFIINIVDGSSRYITKYRTAVVTIANAITGSWSTVMTWFSKTAEVNTYVTPSGVVSYGSPINDCEIDVRSNKGEEVVIV